MGQRNNDGILPGQVEDYRPKSGADERLHPGEEKDNPVEEGDRLWLGYVKDSFRASTDFLNDSIRSQWEDSLSRFHSQHPKGSKYYSNNYKKRSKIFRPKTRSASRRAEATAAKALFSNADLIDVRGQNKGSAAQAASALINKELLQYRLEHSIPWFVTAMGARQDSYNYGVCVSLSSWKYEVEESVDIIPAFDEMGAPLLDEEGRELGEESITQTVRHDKPILDLIPPENLRFDPNADWRNVIEDSPIITLMLSMYIGKIEQKMQNPNPVTGQPEWREYTRGQILAANQSIDENESIRQARDGYERQDAQDTTYLHTNLDTAWVHLNIVRHEGVDYAYYTLGTRLMLTDPRPVREVLPLGRESITVGFSIVEAHRVYPIGGNELGAPLQSEINDVANQRMDNVKLALNKRFILKRGKNIDQAALMRSVPGGGVLADDPDGDVKTLEYKDVTASSYQEHDRLSQEQDELVGNFSGSSVQANRSLNETVGGMQMLQGDASSVAEYELRTWIETWVEPVLRKLQKLEAMFETDETVLALAGENSEVFQKYGTDVAVDELIDKELIVSVNVGMGNTDPMQKLQRIGAVMNAIQPIPEIGQRLNSEEIGKELFSAAGFSDGERFVIPKEEWEAEQKKIAEAAQPAQQPPPPDHTMEIARLKADTDLRIEQMRTDAKAYDTDKRSQTELEKLAGTLNLKVSELYEKLGIDREKLQDARDITALKEGNKSREMNLKREMGSGI